MKFESETGEVSVVTPTAIKPDMIMQVLKRIVRFLISVKWVSQWVEEGWRETQVVILHRHSKSIQ